MNDLRITTVQSPLHWEDCDKNLVQLGRKLDELTEPTDIIVLPEMFTTGFTMKPELLAEEHGGKGLQWMMEKAKQKQCVITGSISVREKDRYFNRLYWVKPDGRFQHYDKRHLFRMGDEHKHYQAGTERLIVECEGWKICPLVCYDLRFPVWSRNTKNNTYDVLIYVANWPEVRSYPWKQLLIARAIENQAYVVGVNRIGQDGNAFSHSGDSAVINPRGEVLSSTKAHEDKMETMVLSYKYLAEFRKLFPVMMDGDDFNLEGII
jgi:predicted amidohydrolase